MLRSLLIGVLLLSACQAREQSDSRTLPLAPCRLESGGLSARCGTLEVFENRKTRSGRKLAISVVVLPSLSSTPLEDPLFLLAGGPGQAASDIAAMLATALEKVRRNRDIVVVDQRGTGRSNPLHCDFDAPELSLGERLLMKTSDERLDECVDSLKAKADLRFYGTLQAIEDLDDVRAALGYERINLWGGSYGTRVALAYMRQFPTRVRSAVLDGVAPLTLLLPLDVAKDTDRALSLLFRHCEASESCSKTWPGIEKTFHELLDRLDAAPITATVSDPLSGEPAEITLTREAFVSTLRGLLYQAEATSLIPLTIARTAEGDLRPFVGQAEMLRTLSANLVSNGMHYAVVCSEDRPFFTAERLRKAGENTALGAAHADELLRVCERMPGGEVPADFREPVQSTLPVLLLSGELDPVTPPRWAEEARQTLPNSRHVVFNATAHGTLGSECARSLVTRFIATADAESLDVACVKDTPRPPFFTSFAGPPP